MIEIIYIINIFFIITQRLVRSPVLRGSSLLHSFLTPGAEMTGKIEPESVGREAGRKVKSLKSKLVIEVCLLYENLLYLMLICD